MLKIIVSTVNDVRRILTKVDLSVNDKLTYAVKKMDKQMKAALKNPLEIAGDAIYDSKINKASVDGSGNLIATIGPNKEEVFSFTVKNKLAHDKELKKINTAMLNTLVDIETLDVDLEEAGYQRGLDLFDDMDREVLEGIFLKCAQTVPGEVSVIVAPTIDEAETVTPFQQCQLDHNGECGTCFEDGTFIKCS